MATHTVHDAKTNLSRLIADALAGKEVIIARRDKPAVRLVPISDGSQRVPGKYKGQFEVTAAFFESLSADELGLWEGDGEP